MDQNLEQDATNETAPKTKAEKLKNAAEMVAAAHAATIAIIGFYHLGKEVKGALKERRAKKKAEQENEKESD